MFCKKLTFRQGYLNNSRGRPGFSYQYKYCKRQAKQVMTRYPTHSNTMCMDSALDMLAISQAVERCRLHVLQDIEIGWMLQYGKRICEMVRVGPFHMASQCHGPCVNQPEQAAGICAQKMETPRHSKPAPCTSSASGQKLNMWLPR